MNPDFWLRKWADNQIAFHNSEANSALVDHFPALALPIGSRVFVPLCGKTRDIAWLLAQGQRVAGVELAQLAVEELFEELGVQPEISTPEALTLYSAQDIDIFVADIFDLSHSILGPIDAVYDRAALVALPEAMRRRYAAHLKKITSSAPQLLVTFEYDQTQMEGPPFSIMPDELIKLYSDHFNISRLDSKELSLKGRCDADESVWLLQKSS